MLKIGHRGAPGNPRYGENTLLSFQKAIWKGATTLEFDVRITRDGELVVIHDLDVARTTNGRGLVENMDLAELILLDAGFGASIPTLVEVFDEFGGKTLLNVWTVNCRKEIERFHDMGADGICSDFPELL